MDRKRIEWLFLIIFALIDVYLGIEIWRSPVSLSSRGTSPATTISSEMRDNGIDVPSDISDKQQSGYYLAVKDRDYLSTKVVQLSHVNAHYSKNSNSLTAEPKTTVVLDAAHQSLLKQLDDFKNDPKNVPYGKNFKYEANMSGGNNYTYVQTSNYGDVFDGAAQLIITVRDKRLVNYTISYLGPVSAVREPQLVISAKHVVKAMYTDREIPNNSRVIKVKLGYSKLTEVRGSTILLPTWLIWVESKTTKNVSLKRVNAFTAQILQANNSYDVTKN